MLKKTILLPLLVLFALTAGCAQTPRSRDITYLSAPPAAVQPDKKSGVVTFYRPWSLFGAAISYFITENKQAIGPLMPGTYFSINASPGEHIYEAETEAETTIAVTVKPNETQYVKGSVGLGFWAGRPVLKPAGAEDFKAAAPKLKYAELSETGRQIKVGEKRKPEPNKPTGNSPYGF